MKRRAGLCVAVLLAGCGHSPPSRFLTLDAVPPRMATSTVSKPPLRITAVRLPATLDRVEFVSVPGPGRIAVHDQDRWASSPGELAREALLRDLALRLPPGGVLPLDAGPAQGSWRVDLDILAMNAGPTGATLDGVLTLVADKGITTRHVALHLIDPQPIAGDDRRALPVVAAQAYSRLLAQVADRIVEEAGFRAP